MTGWVFVKMTSRMPGVDPRTVDVGFAVDGVSLGRVFLYVRRLFSVSILTSI